MTLDGPDYRVTTFAERPDLMAEADRIGGAAWPEFMLHDPVALKNWYTLIAMFADCQLMLLENDEIIALANAVPIQVDMPFADLPSRGVEWGVEKSIADGIAGHPANALMGVQVVVSETHKGKGLSARATAEMIALARRKQIPHVIVPVRPSHKHRFPLIPMESYVAWRTAEGLPFDGWLRVHARAGGETIKICAESMRIPGTVADWADWTGLTFPGSGRYLIEGALNPVDIDVERNLGMYVEPNVWVLHRALDD